MKSTNALWKSLITKALSGEIGFKEYLEKVDGF